MALGTVNTGASQSADVEDVRRLAQSANETAVAAQSLAGTANENAATAKSTADAALEEAGEAKRTAQTAQQTADNAISGLAGKAEKAASPTAGHFAGLDSSGNLTDSGKKRVTLPPRRIHTADTPKRQPRRLRATLPRWIPPAISQIRAKKQVILPLQAIPMLREI